MKSVVRVPALAGEDLIELTLELDDGNPKRIVCDGSTFEGRDWIAALTALRRELEGRGVLVCCNGARRNAWASGMARDMGEGRVVYLLDLGAKGRSDQVAPVFDAAPADEVATLDEQGAWHAAWLRSIGADP